MKNNILLMISLFITPFALAFGEKDSVSGFTYRKMAFADFPALAKCDACGCSASGGSMGFSSMLNNNFVGIRYFSQQYTSRDGIFSNSPWIDENFNTIQVWSKIPITKNIQVSLLLPFHFHNRRRATGNETIEGLGDITVIGMYTVARTRNDSAAYFQKLQVGAGLKAPTGKYKSSNNEGSVNPSFQVGTGSWDYLIALEYVINRKKLGLNTLLNYSLKTENKKHYQFGDQFNYASTLFYLFDTKQVKWVPQIGFAGEVYEKNRQYKQKLPNTSGDIVFGKFGIEAGHKQFSIGINAMLPVSQHLTNSNVEANYRWSLNFNYTL